MDLAPQALAAAAPIAPAAPATPDLDRALADLAEQATTFARTPPRDKAALLRAALPRLLEAAPAMAAAICRARGLDPESPAAAGAWITGPIAAITHARQLAESLEDIVAAGRPALPAREIQKRADGRVIARIAPRSWVERASQRGRETYVLFEAGVEPEDVIAGQAAFYRKTEPEGGVALVSTVLDALSVMFVEGHVALLAIPDDAADLGPILDRALAPLVERGFLRVARAGHAARARLDAHAGIGLRVGGAPWSANPLIVVPCLYAKDELTFLAQSVASQLAHGDGPGAVLLPDGWLQQSLFLDLLQQALAVSAPAWKLAAGEASPAVPNQIFVMSIGSEDPIEMASAAAEFWDVRAPDGRSAQLVVHPIHEYEPEITAAVERAVLSMPCRTVGINRWPALARHLAATRMLARVDKTVSEGPLRPMRKPAYFCDNRDALRVARRLAAFAAAPRAGDLFAVVGRC